MTALAAYLHRWRWSNLSAWTELDLFPGELVVRKKGVEQRLPMADLRGIILRSQEMTPGRSVVLHFREGQVVTLSDWAPQGFGGRQQEQGRLALSLGLIVEAIPRTQRSQVTWRVTHSRAAWTLVAGLVGLLVGGTLWVALAWAGPPPGAMQVAGDIIEKTSALIALIGGALVIAAARGWPTQTRAWQPWIERLPERWRLRTLDLLDAYQAYLLWHLQRRHAPAWPSLLPAVPGTAESGESAPPGLLAPAVVQQDTVIVGEVTWRWDAAGIVREAAHSRSAWPKAQLRHLHWRRSIGRRTLILGLGAEDVAITDVPGQLTAWATSLRTAHPEVPATVAEDARRRAASWAVLALVIAGGLGLAGIAVIGLLEPGTRHQIGDLKVLGMALIGISWATFAPPDWLRTGLRPRCWTNGDPEAA